MDWQEYRHAEFVESNKRSMLRQMNEYQFIVIKFYTDPILVLFPSNIEIGFNLLIKYLFDFHLSLFYTNKLQVSYRAIFCNRCKFPVTP